MDTYELMNNLYHSDQSLIVKARSRKDNLIYILKIFTSNKINGFPHHSIIIAIIFRTSGRVSSDYWLMIYELELRFQKSKWPK